MRNLFILCLAFLLSPIGAKADDENSKTSDYPVDSQFVWQKDLNELVVTGQGGAVAKRRLSSNITKLSAKDLELFPTTRIDQMLAFSWKVLLPLALANVLFTGVGIYARQWM